MEKIYQHIEKLLGRNEYVVVPELGGFVLQQLSASIVDTKITAPRKVISFNALMHHADGLLVIEIARTERISYRLAQELLVNEILSLKKHLQANGNFVFGDFGTFYLTNEGNFEFIPNFEAAFIPSNFGLNDLNLPNYIQKHQQFVPSNQKQPSIKRVLRYAAAIALLVSISFFQQEHIVFSDAQSAAIVNLNRLTSEAKMQINADSLLTNDSVQMIAKQIDDAVLKTESANYHVIVASMPTQQTAENYCKILTELNYSAAKVLEPHKTYRVAIKSFTDKEEAIQFMEELRTTDERFATAWVLCKN